MNREKDPYDPTAEANKLIDDLYSNKGCLRDVLYGVVNTAKWFGLAFLGGYAGYSVAPQESVVTGAVTGFVVGGALNVFAHVFSRRRSRGEVNPRD